MKHLRDQRYKKTKERRKTKWNRKKRGIIVQMILKHQKMGNIKAYKLEGKEK